MLRSWTPLIVLSVSSIFAQSQTIHFQRKAEPRERAFTLLAPMDWRLQGGIVRVNPLTSGGALNAIAAKLDMTLSSPDGRIALHWYPETTYIDGRRMPAAAMFPPGSNYNGATVWPVRSAFEYIEEGFRRLHPRASAVQVRHRIPLPGVAASYQQVTRAMRIPIEFRYDVGLLVLAYQENGAAWEESIYTAVQDFGPAGAGLWSNKDTFGVRAPAGQLDKTGPVVALILQSFEINSQWLLGEIQGQIQRNEIAIRTQQEIARLDREITEHRRRTNSEINNQLFHNLMGTDEYVNPITKKVEVGSNAWAHRWVNSNGEAVYSDDPNFDPLRAGLQGFQRSPVRKRFPEK